MPWWRRTSTLDNTNASPLDSEFYHLKQELAVQIERKAYDKAQTIVQAWLRLAPNNTEALKLKQSLDQRMALTRSTADLLLPRRPASPPVPVPPVDDFNELKPSIADLIDRQEYEQAWQVVWKCLRRDPNNNEARILESQLARRLPRLPAVNTATPAPPPGRLSGLTLQATPTPPPPAPSAVPVDEEDGDSYISLPGISIAMQTPSPVAALPPLENKSAFTFSRDQNLLQVQEQLTRFLEEGAYERAHQQLLLLMHRKPDSRDLVHIKAEIHNELTRDLPEGEVRCLQGHRNSVNVVCFSPAGHQIFSGGGDPARVGADKEQTDRSARLWDPVGGNELRKFVGHGSAITCAVWAPNSAHIVTGSVGGTICVWDVERGDLWRTLQRGEAPTRALAFTPRGNKLLSGGDSGTVRVWDMNEENDRPRRLVGHQGALTALVCLPDGLAAVSGGADKTLRVWDLLTGRQTAVWSGPKDAILAIAVSPDGKLVASSSADRTVRLWNVAEGKEVHRFIGHGNVVRSLVFSPDGQRLLTGSADKTLRFWDVDHGTELARLSGHQDAVTSVAISPDGLFGLSGSADRTVRYWRLPRPSSF